MSTAERNDPAVKLPPRIETGRDLLLEGLGRLLTIEETLAKLMLPKLILELQDGELKSVVQEHLDQTHDHVGNIKRAFLSLGEAPAGKPAYALDGLRTELGATAPQVAAGARDAVHCAAVMATEHYELNAYEAAIRLADALGARDVPRLLRLNLDQEVAALDKLGPQADRLTRLAVKQQTA